VKELIIIILAIPIIIFIWAFVFSAGKETKIDKNHLKDSFQI
jgi:hypothetical protein